MPMRITKPGKDISSVILDDYYLHMDYPLLKVHSFGTFATSAFTGNATINHNLGYKPFSLVFSQFVNFDESVTPEYYQHDWFVLGASVTFYGTTFITDTQLQIAVGHTSTSRPYPVVSGFYYILIDEVGS